MVAGAWAGAGGAPGQRLHSCAGNHVLLCGGGPLPPRRCGPIIPGAGKCLANVRCGAIAVIGGLLTSTVLSLLVVPVVFTYLDDLGQWSGRMFRKLTQTRSIP